MTQTKKFSQFNGPSPIEPTDIVVGLRVDTDGVLDNWQFTGINGSGGGSGVTQVITSANNLSLGQWVEIDLTGHYVPALATTPALAEVIGVVVQIIVPNLTFVVQQSGYITNTENIFVDLIKGNPYFLDTIVPGNMVNVDALIDGQVSRPVFVPDSATSGWVIPYRGFVVNGDFNRGPVPMADSNIVTVTQPNTFIPGNWVRVSTPSGGTVQYVLAQANTLANSQVAGVVISATPTTFVLQFAGYNVGAVTQDQSGVPPLVPSTVYYLSSTVPGSISATDPIISGGLSKPVFISEQTTGTVSVNAGYVLPQRPLGGGVGGIGGSPSSAPVFLGQLNSINTYGSPTILSGFRAYQIILINPDGLNVISASGGGLTRFGFQLFFAVTGYDAALHYSHYMYGVNSSANPTTTGVLYGDVRNTSQDTSLVVASAVSTVQSFGAFNAILTINGAMNNTAQSGALTYQSWVVDNSAAPLPNGIGYGATGIAVGGGSPGNPITGLKLVAEGGATILPTASYFAIFGLPNV